MAQDQELTFELVTLQRLNGAELGVLRTGISAGQALTVLQESSRADYGSGVVTFLRAETAQPDSFESLAAGLNRWSATLMASVNELPMGQLFTLVADLRGTAYAAEASALQRVVGEAITTPGLDTRSVRAWLARMEDLEALRSMLTTALDEIDVLRGQWEPGGPG
jgi:hypothetical protein